MTEEDAFYLLCTVVEDILPNYYSHSMMGSLLDLEVMNQLVQSFLPDSYELFSSVGGVQITIVPWFMCLYIHYLPWRASLHTLDLLFSLGSRALFVVGLAVLKTVEPRLLTSCGDYLLCDLKQLLHEMDLTEWMKNTKVYESLVSDSYIRELRDLERPDVIGDIREEMGQVSEENAPLVDSLSLAKEVTITVDDVMLPLPSPRNKRPRTGSLQEITSDEKLSSTPRGRVRKSSAQYELELQLDLPHNEEPSTLRDALRKNSAREVSTLELSPNSPRKHRNSNTIRSMRLFMNSEEAQKSV